MEGVLHHHEAVGTPGGQDHVFGVFLPVQEKTVDGFSAVEPEDDPVLRFCHIHFIAIAVVDGFLAQNGGGAHQISPFQTAELNLRNQEKVGHQQLQKTKKQGNQQKIQ